MNESFLNTVFPYVEVHSKKIDEYLKDEGSEYQRTVFNDRIKFHDQNAYDPGWCVKRCYTLLIAATS